MDKLGSGKDQCILDWIYSIVKKKEKKKEVQGQDI